MVFKKIVAIGLLLAFYSSAAEQDQLVTTDFVLKAGASQSRTVDIYKPAHLDRLVMVGFNPVNTLSVDCTLRLFDASHTLLATYNCTKPQHYFFKTPMLVAVKVRAEVEVTNSNYTSANSSFSLISRFKFTSVSE
ncbi:hypothetical protein [Rheinheimera mangrovi]|uniref:hypothetical protein n=1 Tax=Rheinheimera mangrovi TaxID=2498451 RepID=UPI000F8D2E21|nr:hypothetical protein [Rheinheimera mangrovi]